VISGETYSAAAMERMMKLQDVLLKAMAKKITWWAAAEIIGVSDRTMRRMRERLERDGYSGLADRRKGQVSSQRIPLKTAEEVLRLYREQYSDFNVRHFHEKLREQHQIEISYTWVYAAVIEAKGLFCALYSDRGSHFFVTPKAGEPVDKQRLTQVGRAMKELGVQMIAAYSPQARGRSERSFGTWQGRLPQELRVAGITSPEEANRFLREQYIGVFNAKFMVKAAQRGTAFRRCGRADLDWIFTVQTERVVAKDNTVAIASRSWQLDKSRFRHSLAGCTVTIHEHMDATISIRYGPHVVGRFEANGKRRGKVESPRKQRPSHFPTATTATALPLKPKKQAARAA
jgi:transposase